MIRGGRDQINQLSLCFTVLVLLTVFLLPEFDIHRHWVHAVSHFEINWERMMSIMSKWNDYRPTKAGLIWAAVGASVLTMVVGFTWGGWVTGGSAQAMAEKGSQNAREQLVASICVENFIADSNATANLVALKEESSYQRDNFIEDGGWNNITALDEQVTGAARLCAQQLVAMEALPARTVGTDSSPIDMPASDG